MKEIFVKQNTAFHFEKSKIWTNRAFQRYDFRIIIDFITLLLCKIL